MESQLPLIRKWTADLNCEILEDEWFDCFQCIYSATISSQIRSFEFRIVYTNEKAT